MSEPDKRPVTLEELLVSSLAQTDALAKLLIEKGLIRGKSSCRRFRRNGRRIKQFLSHFTLKIGSFLSDGHRVVIGIWP
jgi:hypothetical protein